MRWIVALALLLAGCAAQQGPTAAERQSRDIGIEIDKTVHRADECAKAIERSPEYERIGDRFTLGKPSMEMLTNKTRPTLADTALLLAVHKQLSACRSEMLQGLGAAHPAFVSGAATTFNEADIDFAKLVSRDITWGDYAQLRLARNDRFNSRYQEAAQKIKTGLDTAHNRENQERQAASRALRAWAQTQQSAFPVTTNCVYAGPVLSCSSY